MFRKPNLTRISKVIEAFEQSEYPKLLSLCENGDSKLNIVNDYHREATILDHTKMVYDYVYDHFKAYSEYNILLIGALLHDIGKIKTRAVIPEKRKVTFYEHEMAGIWYTLEFFKSLDDSLLRDDEKEQILKIVAFHDVYKYTAEQNSKRFNSRDLCLLYTFHEADAKGRISDIKKLERLTGAVAQPRIKKNKTVCFMIGVPGSGKSSYVKQLTEKSLIAPTIIERDDILIKFGKKRYKYQTKDATYSEIFKLLTPQDHTEIDGLLYKEIKEKLKLIGGDIIIDKTNTSTKSRRHILHMVPQLNDDKICKKCVVMLTPLSEVKKRLNSRGDIEGKYITDDVLEKFVRAFRLPDLTEFDEIKYVF